MNEQIMIGNDLMAVPILYEGKISTTAYFPSADWYYCTNGSKIHSWNEGGKNKIVYNYLPETIPLFI